MRPLRPARPLNGTVAIVAPRASSSCQTDSRAEELAPAGAEPRLMDARGLAPGRACDTAHLGAPYISGTTELAIRARRVAATGGRVLLGIVDPTARARGGPAGRAPLLEPERAVAHPPRARLAPSPASRSRSGQAASGGPGGPPPPARRGPVSALEIRKTNGGEQRVHSASTRSTTTVNRPQQPYSPDCGCLQGFRARLRASVNARKTLTLPW